MPQFGSRSLEILSTCDNRLVLIADRAIETMDFSVISGHRGFDEQERLYREKKTKLKWPHSKHNHDPSLAFDLAPYPINWSNHPKAVARFYLLAGVILRVADELMIPLRWGGDWDGDWDLFDQKFDDLGHFELDD